MESSRNPHGVYEDSVRTMRSPHRVHANSWVSVKYSCIYLTGETRERSKITRIKMPTFNAFQHFPPIIAIIMAVTWITPRTQVHDCAQMLWLLRWKVVDGKSLKWIKCVTEKSQVESSTSSGSLPTPALGPSGTSSKRSLCQSIDREAKYHWECDRAYFLDEFSSRP